MLNENLKQLRKSKGLSQGGISNKIKCSSSNNFEMGKRVISSRCRYVNKNR